jgi:hypothetical protein
MIPIIPIRNPMEPDPTERYPGTWLEEIPFSYCLQWRNLETKCRTELRKAISIAILVSRVSGRKTINKTLSIGSRQDTLVS